MLQAVPVVHANKIMKRIKYTQAVKTKCVIPKLHFELHEEESISEKSLTQYRALNPIKIILTDMVCELFYQCRNTFERRFRFLSILVKSTHPFT